MIWIPLEALAYLYSSHKASRREKMSSGYKVAHYKSESPPVEFEIWHKDGVYNCKFTGITYATGAPNAERERSVARAIKGGPFSGPFSGTLAANHLHESELCRLAAIGIGAEEGEPFKWAISDLKRRLKETDEARSSAAYEAHGLRQEAALANQDLVRMGKKVQELEAHRDAIGEVILKKNDEIAALKARLGELPA